ncbi:hypothetical protein BC937DRAFT_89900 [Endogone sp. FLAS-F59071]|nr:hypothetical protein BC937DRAFT_89900 [Endogone sp. FLAS-F59071]|eukprot:RUS17507.1 hypothetical protein BC937DRAFT_89900 [Endogone sp. FLAS-F59071]
MNMQNLFLRHSRHLDAQLFNARLAPPALFANRLALRPLATTCNTPRLLFTHRIRVAPPKYRPGQYTTSTAAAPTATTQSDNNNVPPPENKYKTFLDYFPPKVAPYVYLLRLDKPIGTWLLYWPCAWSITMASYHAHLPITQTAYMLGIFGIGSMIMRGVACTINDIVDSDIDRKVERTRGRPLVSGVITPFQALSFLGLQLSCGLVILTQLNWYSIVLSVPSFPLIAVYPYMKRITYWPQSVLGLAFNWGALLGWSAMLGSSNWAVTAPLYVGGVCWTMIYDTIYAHQDKKDDIQIGVKSTALLFGTRTPQWLTLFSTSFVSLTALAGYMNAQGLPFYAVSVVGTAAHLAWQLWTVSYNDPADCWKKFASNKWTGGLVCSGIVLDGVWRSVH